MVIYGTGTVGLMAVKSAFIKGAAMVMMDFNFGEFWFNGQQIRTGQCNVKAYNRRLSNLIEAGKASPSFIVSHELPLEAAPEAYKNFDARKKGWTKVILKPGA